MEQALDYIAQYKKVTDPLLRSFIIEKKKQAARIGEVPFALVTHMAKIIEGGKRLRGALVCLGYELGGGKSKDIYKASLSVELLHASLLFHDDIFDGDKRRRGVSTVHEHFGGRSPHYGISMGINAGDLAFAWALEILSSAQFPSKNIVAASRLLSEFFSSTLFGQVLDISMDARDNTPTEEIMKLHRLKTAEYTGVLPLLLGGAIAGTEDQALTEDFRKYGRALGAIFQLRDDALDGKSAVDANNGEKILEEGKNTVKQITDSTNYQDLLLSMLDFSWNRNT